MAARSRRLEDVLRAVRRGRVAYLGLTREQKRALRDPDGQIALDVLRDLLGARPAVLERFPLTEGAFQAIAGRLGYAVGQKRSRGMVVRLAATGVVVRAGHYRQPYRNSPVRSGFRVALYRLGCAVGVLRPARRKRPVGNAPRVKKRSRARWWQHPLFGDITGLPPPDIPPARLARMKSLDEAFQSAH